MKPYYDHAGITIYHGDCRDVLSGLAFHHPRVADVIVSDPVWPNAHTDLAGAERATELFAEAAQFFPGLSSRLVVQLGCDSDPRFLAGVPASLPFFRTAFLEYVRPHYKGRLMYTNDVAYVFGSPPPSEKGAHVMPGRFMQTTANRAKNAHPTPRNIDHVKWLLRWYARGTVLDPFAGSGTTLLAAKTLGLPAIGIEIEEKYCAIAAKRLEQEVLCFDEKQLDSKYDKLKALDGRPLSFLGECSEGTGG